MACGRPDLAGETIALKDVAAGAKPLPATGTRIADCAGDQHTLRRLEIEVGGL